MPLIVWSESLSVGVKKFDTQHQKLISLINDLHDSLKTEDSEALLPHLVEEIILYVKEHLDCEEEYFEKYAYPDRDSHIAEHNAFRKKADGFRKEIEKGNKELLLSIMKFLSDWLLDHIQEKDKAYASFFAGKELS